jgi:hypothetical protein
MRKMKTPLKLGASGFKVIGEVRVWGGEVMLCFHVGITPFTYKGKRKCKINQ